MVRTNKKPRFHLGDRVKFEWGRYRVTGVILEERGALGIGGRYLYRVSIPQDPFEPMSTIVPEDEIEAIPADAPPPPPLEKQKIIQYLGYGGLISILQSHLNEGMHHPIAWLCRDNLGNVTHTFYPERGMVGGQYIPFGSVRDNKIHKPKLEIVRSYLESFGLNREEAEEVISEVGIQT